MFRFPACLVLHARRTVFLASYKEKVFNRFKRMCIQSPKKISLIYSVIMWYFYVMQSVKNTEYFYKGSTGNLEKRLAQHNAGETDSCRPYRPLKLVYYEAYISEVAARKREMAVKISGSVSVPLMKRIKDSLDVAIIKT